MTKPRRQLVSLNDTPYYHCVGRCVRRAFLCGNDGKTCYEHRRQWVEDRIKLLSSIFTIDIAAYAIMSNHYHLVLHIDRECAKALSDTDVIDRWLSLHKGPNIIQQHRCNPITDPVKLGITQEYINEWRERLHSLSWFMKELNEHIAKHANREDGCTGHFWESRFKSQALLDETALFSCMAYVDLNPIRANMAITPETSDYTSIQERLGITPPPVEVIQEEEVAVETNNKIEPAALMSFSGTVKYDTASNQLPFNLSDYIELIDWTGRALRDDKKGKIPENTPPILERLNIDPEKWRNTCTRIETDYYLAIGPVEKLQALAERLNQSWVKGINSCRLLYSKSPAT